MHTLNIPFARTQTREIDMHTLYILCANKMQTTCTQYADQMQTKCIFFACIRIANLSHLHLLMMGPKRPSVDKLLAKEVLVPDVKAAEDLNLRPVATAPTTLGTCTLLHVPHQPPNLTCRELIVPSVGYRQP